MPRKLTVPREALCFVLASILIVGSGCVPHPTGPPLTQIEGPEPGKVVVYLYLSDYTASDQPIYVNDTLITRSVKHSYYRHVTDPGLMTFSNGKHPRPQDQVMARLQAGTMFFIKLRVISWATPLGRAFDLNLVPVDEATALRELPGLRLVLPSDVE